jgi:protein tyrosine phosphatase (PTP) superfamily phosphohydrolase (DUF442 family)
VTNAKLRARGIALACIIVVTVSVGLAWHYLTGTYHLAMVRPGVLYRDGARSVHELGVAVGRVKANTVVSLIDDNELHDPKKPQFAQELGYLSERGVHYQRIAVKLGGWPTSEDIQAFLKTAENPTSQPVLLHCAQGVRRTAMFVAAYQESVMGYDKTKAKDAILTFGHSDNTIEDIKRFIDHYDPRTRTVTDLP